MSGNISSTLINGGNFVNNNFTSFCIGARNSADWTLDGSQQSFIQGGSAPKSNPLPFYIPFFGRKDTPSYTFCWQWYPFHMPGLELYIPLNCCKCTVFKIRINHKTRPFSRRLFSQPCNASVSPFWAYRCITWSNSRVKSLPLSGGASPYRPF